MFGWDDAQKAHQEVYGQNGPDNKASFSHELLGGAAAFEAMKQYEQHQDVNGKPESHEMAKMILAGFAGAEADRLVETKGENFYEKERIQHEAKKNAEHFYDQRYAGQGHQNY